MKLITAGESHGKCLVGTIEGYPSNVTISTDKIDQQLHARQQGYGRGGRMKIETDKVDILTGVRGGKSLGSPIAFMIKNKDHEKWLGSMDAMTGDQSLDALTAVRPGHADLSGMIKYGFDNARNVLERASARETAVRVAAGSICRQALDCVGISITSNIVHIGGFTGENEIKSGIDNAKKQGDTLGGEVSVVVKNMPIGVGSYVHYDRKLDAILAMHIMSIQSVKAVGFGLADKYAHTAGSKAHDEIFPDGRRTNNAGGIEGGMSNGEDIVIKITFKPIPTLMNGLNTVDVKTKSPTIAASERSDTCAVEAAAVVAENVTAYAVLDQLLATFGGDTIDELVARVEERRAKCQQK